MDIFCQDTKLNISSKYLRPGFAFGGSCLPKDVRALTYKGRSLDLELPLINAIMPSNRSHIERALQMVLDLNERNVGVLGLSFKAGTDDLRESPVVELVERLLGKGHEIRIFDRNVNLSRLVGVNRAYIYQHLPHIAKLMVDHVDEVVNHGGTIVIGNRDRYFSEVVGRLNMVATRCRSGADRRRTARTMASAGNQSPRPHHRPEPAGPVRPAGLARGDLADRGGLRRKRDLPEGEGLHGFLRDAGRRRHLSLRASRSTRTGAVGFVVEFAWCFLRTCMKSVRIARRRTRLRCHPCLQSAGDILAAWPGSGASSASASCSTITTCRPRCTQPSSDALPG